jgi:hypothetical protein
MVALPMDRISAKTTFMCVFIPLVFLVYFPAY